MRLATLKKDLYFGRGGVLPKGATIQVSKSDLDSYWIERCRVWAPGGLYFFVYKWELDNVVEFLDDETGDT